MCVTVSGYRYVTGNCDCLLTGDDDDVAVPKSDSPGALLHMTVTDTHREGDGDGEFSYFLPTLYYFFVFFSFSFVLFSWDILCLSV